MKTLSAILLLSSLGLSFISFSQELDIKNAFPEINEGLEYRCIGPFRGGDRKSVV